MRTKMNNKNKGNLLWGLGALRLQYWAGFLNFGGIRNKRHFLCNITTKQGGKGVGGSPLFGTLDIFGAFSILFFIQVRGGRQGSSSPPPSPQSFIGWGLKTLPAENPQIGQDNLYSTTTATTTTGGNPKWGLSENRRLPVSILMLRKLLSQQTWDKLRMGFLFSFERYSIHYWSEDTKFHAERQKLFYNLCNLVKMRIISLTWFITGW